MHAAFELAPFLGGFFCAVACGSREFSRREFCHRFFLRAGAPVSLTGSIASALIAVALDCSFAALRYPDDTCVRKTTRSLTSRFERKICRRKTTRGKNRLRPGKRSAKAIVTVRESGPRKWLFPILESAIPRSLHVARRRAVALPEKCARRANAAPALFAVIFNPAREKMFSQLRPTPFWVDRLREYKQRKAASFITRTTRGPVVPGAKNWSPLGPSVVLNGQAQGYPSVGGRVSGIAVANGGQIVYAASANGGVFRSDDAGQSWRSLMDGFDLDPTNFASTSLACGAIAIDLNDPNRI